MRHHDVMIRRTPALLVALLVTCVTACSSPGAAAPTAQRPRTTTGSAPAGASAPSPREGHVVVVMMENHSYADIVGSRSAPYLNALARTGTSFSRMRAITHPSQPNYIALFSGSTHGVRSDACPQRLRGDTLATELGRSGRSFAAYSEGLPRTGSSVCSSGHYARKHDPWTDFPSVPTKVGRPFTAFPTDYTTLPTVSFVVPDLRHDMHDGTVAQGDAWLRSHLGRYATWARTHHSLLIVTWDEDDYSASNHIPTIVVGQGVPARKVSRAVTLYSVLRAVQDRYHVARIGGGRNAPSLGLPSA